MPTLTEPVSTSNAGACPPLAVTPLLVALSSRRLGAADLVDVDEAGRDRGDDRDDGEDEDKEDGAHVVSPDLTMLVLTIRTQRNSCLGCRRIRAAQR